MPFSATVLKVFIASPGDVADERRAIRQVVAEWNAVHAEDRGTVLLPVGWETDASPLMGDGPQAVINRQLLDGYDLLVGVFWNRLGTPTETAASGTAEEIELHVRAGKPAMLYFSDAPVRPSELDAPGAAQQRAALAAFKRASWAEGLTESFASAEDFRAKFARQLAQTVIRQFGDVGTAGEGRDEEVEQGPLVRDLLSAEAKRMLTTAAAEDGNVMFLRMQGGTHVQAGQITLLQAGDDQTPRQVAVWRAALDELRQHDLIEDRGYKGEVFEVTHRGFQVAQEIANQQSDG